LSFWEQYRFYIIGATIRDLDFAIEHAKQISDSRELFGEAVDYPITAVRAFEQHLIERKDTLLPSDSSNLTDEEKAFTLFRLSKANWEEEIIWLEQIIAAVKEYSPEIYRQVMDIYYQKQ